MKRMPAGPLGYSLACALLVAAGALVLRAGMGTQHWPIHVFSVLAAMGYLVLVKRDREGTIRQLLRGLQSHGIWWIGFLGGLGILAGILRYQFYRWTGLGGVQLYEREFLPFLQSGSGGERALHYTAFLAGTYTAVLIPGVLFWIIIQEPFGRARLWLVGLLIQASLFGLVHSFMTGSVDPVYGVEAFAGALVSGLAYHYLKNVFIASLFMSASVFITCVLLAIKGSG
jgi:hypothetical protein